jgi:hypothetical protein
LLEQAVLCCNDDHQGADARRRRVAELGDRDGGDDVGLVVPQDFVLFTEIEVLRNRLDLGELLAQDFKSGGDRQRPLRGRGDVMAGPDLSGRDQRPDILAASKGQRAASDAADEDGERGGSDVVLSEAGS